MPSIREFVAEPRFQEQILVASDNSWPRISIVTPSFNQGRFLERTILSVLNQNYPNLEYIVVDGGSTDESSEILRRYERFLSYWVSETDAGQAAAIAKGFRRATGQVLAWLNSDDVYLPGTLQKVAAAFTDKSGASLLYGDCLVIDEDDAVIRGIYPMPFDREVFLFENTIIAQPASFWGREAYARVGGVDPRWSFCMDYDLWARFMTAGVAFVQLRTVLAGFRWHGDSKTMKRGGIERREHDEVVRAMLGREFSRRSRLGRGYLRFKRYAARPRGVIASLVYRLRKLGRTGTCSA